MKLPKISIVTPSYNQGKYLEQTILSVINQKYSNLEYIIIDGGSTDNSVEIIKKYEKHLTYWVSEKDTGQSDAINKGLKRTTGDLFNWINSDDYFETGALMKIAHAYQNNSSKIIFSFQHYLLYENKKKPFDKCNNPADKIQCFCEPVINQPSTFYAMHGVRKVGLLNSWLHYAMDYEWRLRFLFMFSENCMFVSEDKISVFRMHEESKTSKGNDNFVNDIANILWSLSEQVNLNPYSELFKSRFQICENYFLNIPKNVIDKPLLEKMIIFFLLKWCRLIYTRRDFLFAKEILKQISFSKIKLTDVEQKWLSQMRKNALLPNWMAFKVNRKLNYILRAD